LLSLSVAVLAGVSGCKGGPKGPTDSVSGKVTLNGQVVAGTVVFVGADKQESTTPIGMDGTYKILSLTSGQYKILVKGSGLAPGGLKAPPKGTGPEMPSMPGSSSGVAPPAKYGSVATTPFSIDVTGGNQTKDLELTP